MKKQKRQFFDNQKRVKFVCCHTTDICAICGTERISNILLKIQNESNFHKCNAVLFVDFLLVIALTETCSDNNMETKSLFLLVEEFYEARLEVINSAKSVL